MNSWRAYELNLQKTLGTFSKDDNKTIETDIEKDLKDMNLLKTDSKKF